jgi:hypothetical protein
MKTSLARSETGQSGYFQDKTSLARSETGQSGYFQDKTALARSETGQSGYFQDKKLVRVMLRAAEASRCVLAGDASPSLSMT